MKTTKIKNRDTKVFVAVFLFFAFSPYSLLFTPHAHAADWQFRLSISVPYAMGEGGQASQVVTVGVRLTALDGFDNTWDTVALGSTILSAYAYHPEFAANYQFLARDFRSDSYPKQWDIYVSSDQGGQPITMTWSLPSTTMGACLGLTLSMTDVTAGTTVDLTQPSYVYTNSAGVSRQFQLDATQVIETPPPPPFNLFSPRTGTASVLLAWTGVNNPDVVGYHVYRKAAGATEYQRLTPTPAPVAKYLDKGLSPGSYSYQVTATTTFSCESSPSSELTISVGQ